MLLVRRVLALPRSGPVLSALPVAAGLTIVLALLSGALGFTAIDDTWARSSLAEGRGGLGDVSLAQILGTNLASALLLFAGTVTGGFCSLLGVVLTSAFVGATASVGVTNAGASALLTQTGLYLPFELAGFAVAATAGFLPAIAGGFAAQQSSERGRIARGYVDGVHVSLRLFVVAVGLILVAGLVEALVLEWR